MENTENNSTELKPIPGYEGLYSATADGRIYRHARKGAKEGFLKLRTNTVYMRVPLWKNGIITYHHVHRLVASAFIPNSLNKPMVNHKNSNKHDNSVENLEWVTRKENWDHARDNGVFNGVMLSDEQQVQLYYLFSTGNFSRNELARHFGTSLSSVHRHLKKWRAIFS